MVEWLSANLASIVMLLIVILIVFFIIRSMIRQKKQGNCRCGSSCCSGCNGCGAHHKGGKK